MPARLLFSCCLAAVFFLSSCCGSKRLPDSPEASFTEDGKGGITFDEGHMGQEPHPGIENIIKVSLLKEAEAKLFVHYPQGIHEKADAAVRRKVEMLAGRLVLLAMPDLADVPDEASESEEEREMRLSQSRVHPCFINYEVTETGGGALSVRFRSWYYLGGMHDNWTYSALSIDRRGGEIISESRLFNGPKSRERTARWLTERDMEKRRKAEQTLNPFASDLIRIDVTAEDITMDRIAMTPEGLEMRFAPCEKASFSMGDITLYIPKSEFKRLGINREFWK